MAYDDLLLYIGEFGPYQKIVYLLCLLGVAPNGYIMMSSLFFFVEPEFRCAVPGLSNDTFHIQNEAHARMVNASIPFDLKSGKYSECSSYKANLIPSLNNNNTSSVLEIDSNNTQACTRWVYSKDVYTETWTTSLDLVCDRKLFRSHANMMTMVGVLVGSLTGVVSDVIGRRNGFLLFLGLEAVCGVATVFIQSTTLLLILRFAFNLSATSAFLASFVLVSELVGPKRRAFAAMGTMFGWCAGLFFLLLVVFFIRDWRMAQIAFTCPSVLFISFYWLLPESPRWLISKGRYAEARQVIVKMAKVNKVKVTEELILSTCKMGSWKAGEDTEVQEPVKQLKIWHVLRHPTLALRLFIICFNWITNSLVYYGLALNMDTLVEGNIFLNFAVMTTLEVLAYVIVICLFRYVGRKVLYCSSVLLAGVACLATMIPVLTDSKMWWINVVLSSIGKFGVTASFAIIFIFTAELLPTALRNSGLGFSSFCSRLGSISSSYIALVGLLVSGKMSQVLPLIIFGCMAIAAGLMALWLPETRNQKLPETFEEIKPNKTTSGEHYELESASQALCVSCEKEGMNKHAV